MKHVKLGFINYTNTVPVYYGLLTGRVKFEGHIIKEIPGKLNRMLQGGELHISPVSSIEYARYQKDYYLLNNFCINSTGYVKSVLLVSKYPIEELNDKTIGLTPASETSRALLKILFSDYYNIKPVYIDLKKTTLTEEAVDGALLIGDDALNFKNPAYPCSFDLGDLWKKHTDMPVVFAVWAVRKDFADKYHQSVREIEKILSESYEYGLSNKEGIIEFAKSICPEPECTYKDYFRHLGYNFTEEKRKALLFFYEKASKLGLCEVCNKLEFFM
jgi:chorismate dehydratase